MDKQLDARLQEAQVAIIGSMLIDDRCIGDVLAQISVDDFPAGVFRTLFDTMRQLFCDGRPVDPVIVLDALQGGQELGRCIRDCMELTPTAANVLEYCKVLRELSRVARLQQIGMALCSASSLEDAGKIVAEANGLLVQQSGLKIMDAEALMLDFYRRMQEERKPEYIRTGFDPIDDMTFLELGDMVGIGAAPSTGKTAFALQWAARLSQKYRVGFYSLETKAEKAADRLVAQLSGTPLADIKMRRFTDDQWAKIGDASAAFAQGKFEHVPASAMSAEDIVSTALSRRHQVIFVDYIQLVGSSDRKTHSSVEVVTNTSMVLHHAAQTHGILVVTLSQLSRPEKKDGKPVKPDMHSFRESGQIEQDLDVAMLLYLSDPDDTEAAAAARSARTRKAQRARWNWPSTVPSSGLLWLEPVSAPNTRRKAARSNSRTTGRRSINSRSLRKSPGQIRSFRFEGRSQMSNWMQIMSCPYCGGKIRVSVHYCFTHDYFITKSGMLSRRYLVSDLGPLDCITAGCCDCLHTWDSNEVVVEKDDTVWVRCKDNG